MVVCDLVRGMVLATWTANAVMGRHHSLTETVTAQTGNHAARIITT